jgi:hypothetical protein
MMEDMTHSELHRFEANLAASLICGGSTGLLWSSARRAAGELVRRR